MINVYLDMDGVLTEFDLYYFNHSNIPTFNKEEFNRLVVEHRMFEILEPTKSISMFKDIIKFYPDIHFCILSSLGNPDDNIIANLISTQKRNWLDLHLPVKSIFVKHKGMKKYFATPNSILIDDTLQNIWDFNEMRGHGILFDIHNQEKSIDLLEDKIVQINKENIIYGY